MGYKLLVSYNSDDQKALTVTMDAEQIPQELELWGWDHFEQCPIYASPGTPHPKEKFDSHHNHKRKVGFESELALFVFQHSHLFLPLLQKIGQGLSKHLDQKSQNSTIEKDIFENIVGEIFSEYLYTDIMHFGRLGPSSIAPDHSASYKIGHDVLKSGTKIEQILTTFLAADTALEALVDEQKMETDKVFEFRNSLKSQLTTNGLFENRIRPESKDAPKSSKKFGITDDSLNLSYELEEHTRPIDNFTRDHLKGSTFAIEAHKREIPLVSGPSGHTVKLLLAALPLAKIGSDYSTEELKQFTLVCASFLIAAGAHSFHEIYTVAQKAGVPYNIGRYEAPIPDLIKKVPNYQQLVKRYSDIIQADLTLSIDNKEEKQGTDSSYNASRLFKTGTKKPHLKITTTNIKNYQLDI